jgi:tetratricopeptide (TPR) repeat protein
MSAVRTIRLFVSSPSDVEAERQRIDLVAERINVSYTDIVRIDVIRWETRFYTADKSFQPQIPEAADCDIVIGIFWARLGSELPPTFPTMPDGTPYPSGSAYEILSSIHKRLASDKSARAGEPQTDVYVFQKAAPPFPAPKDEKELALIGLQWGMVKAFFERWFRGREGQFLAAFHVFSTTDQFEEQVEKLLLQWLSEHALKAQAHAWPIASMGSPFRGLEAFDASHAPVFFGRSVDVVRAADRLKAAARGPLADLASGEDPNPADIEDADRGLPFLLIVGASGAGKSSLARAGVVPRLITPGFVREVDGWRIATMRPGDDATPLGALAKALYGRNAPKAGGAAYAALPEIAHSDYKTPEELVATWRDGALTPLPIVRALDRVGEELRIKRKFDRSPRVDLILVIDQLDELFAAEGGEQEAARLGALLANFAATRRIWIVATLRAALYERYLADRSFKRLRDQGVTFDLIAPGAVELAEIVRKPAEAAGLVFETKANGESLDRLLLADAVDADTLPVLQFILQGLFERREKIGEATCLTFAAYKTLGGIDGAIDKAAEDALHGLGNAEIGALPKLLRRLVASVGSSAVVSGQSAMSIRSVPIESAAATAEASRLIAALVEARILVSDAGSGAATIRFAHQRALESWRRARELVAANADFYRIRSEIDAQYQIWNSRGRKSELLLHAGLPLAEAESIHQQFGDEISPELGGYIVKSGRRARLRQRLTAVAACAFACVAMAAIYYQNQARVGLLAATDAIGALVQGISEVVRPLAQLDTVETLVSQARSSIDKFGGVWRTDAIRKQHARTYLLIAEIDWDRGDIGQMRKDANAALALLSDLKVTDDSETLLLNASGHRFVGLSFFESNEREDARRQYELGIAELEPALSRGFDPSLKLQAERTLANTYQELGDVLLFKFNLKPEANQAFDKCLNLRAGFVESGHHEPAYEHDLAWAYNKHGDVAVRSSDDRAALAWFSRARDGLVGVGDHLWDNLTWAYDLSLVYNNIGLIELRRGDFDDALAAFTQAETIVSRVVAYDPKNLGHRSGLSWTAFNRGMALFRSAMLTKDAGRMREARVELETSTKDTLTEAQQAPLEARVQFGLERNRAYLSAIDASLMDWTGDHKAAAEKFSEAASHLVDGYLPHVRDYPRADFLGECVDYLDWAANAYVAAGMSASARPLLTKARDLVSTHQEILGPALAGTLSVRLERDIAIANGAQ